MPIVKITYLRPEDINWLPLQACTFNLAGSIDLWAITIDRNLSRIDEFWRLLNEDEKARSSRYIQIYDKNRFIISRGVLRILLGNYLNTSPTSIAFGIGSNKKPYVKDCAFSYNISHSGNRIIIALSPAPVGVDVEWINPSFDYSDIVKDYFSEPENKFVIEKDSIFRFFLLWTRKEAITKTNAKGLDDDLKYIPSIDGVYETEASLTGSAADLQVSSFLHGDDHIISLVTADAHSYSRFLDWNL